MSRIDELGPGLISTDVLYLKKMRKKSTDCSVVSRGGRRETDIIIIK